MKGLWYLPGDTGSKSLSSVVTGTGTALPFNHCRQVIGFIEYDPLDPPTSGVVVAEWAWTESYTGNWSNLTSVTLADLVAGTSDASFTYPGGLPFVRWRFTTPSDKAITCYLNGDLN